MLNSRSSELFRWRLIRVEGRRALVEVDWRVTSNARAAWNAPIPQRPGSKIASRRTWGTLVGAKRWLRSPAPSRVP
ncbi:MAG TPA: hypothetical protein VEH57_05975 [Thermoplasmata archaeon]|nr:hypothetical protein [Thermoplasmata archaeon]